MTKGRQESRCLPFVIGGALEGHSSFAGAGAYHSSMNPAPEAPAIPRVTLKIERRSSHPWIFQKMVEKPGTRIPPGSVVDVHDKNGQWVARGFYNGHSRITLRVLTSKQDEAVDEAFFARKIAAAVAFRRDLLKLDEVT